MKKTVAIILSLLLAVSAVSCASGDTDASVSEQTQAQTDAVTEAATDYLDTITEPTAYLSGKTFKILDANDYPDMHINISSGEYSGVAINDALYDRDMLIESKYGVDLVYEQVKGTETGVTQLKNSIAANDGSCDMIIGRLTSGISTLATNGSLLNLCDMPALSLNSEWWSSLLYDSLQINGKMYYTTGDIAPSLYDSPNCIMYNTTLAKEYSINDDLFATVREGKWTWDVLRGLAEDVYTDVNGDGTLIATEDVLGFGCANISLTTNGLASSVGVKLSTVSGDGTLSIDLGSENSILRLGAFNGMFERYTTCADEDFKVSFTEGRILFYNHLIETARYRCRDMEDDYILLPMPKFDEAQASYINMINPWVDCFVGAAVTTDPALTGAAMEVMAYISHRDIYPIVYDVTLKSRVAANSETAEMIDLIFRNIYIDFNAVYDFGSTTTVLNKFIVNGAELSSGLAKTEKATNKTLEKFVAEWNGTAE